jgi:hypothetical protein
MAANFDRNTPVLLQPANSGEEQDTPLPQFVPPAPSGFGVASLSFALVLSAFWIGIWIAYLWGWFGASFLKLDVQQLALFGAAILMPPFLFVTIAVTLTRAHAMGRSADALKEAAERLFTADENASRTAARLGRAVRRELDALNVGLDGAFTRLRALDTALENQISALDEAGTRAQVRTDAIAARLTQETQRLESVSDHMADAAARASEGVAGRAAQLKATIESAEGTLKMAGQSLDVQAAGFRAAISAAAESPHAAAIELDAQAKKIESVSDAAIARAEFVLARQEKHRVQMGELLGRLKEDSALLESALAQQRSGMEQAIGQLGGEAKRFESVTGDAERHLELIMANAANRAGQLTAAFANEAERLQLASDSAATILTTLIATMRDAGTGAQTLIGESAAQARHDARSLVGDAMAECEKLLRAAGEMSAEATTIRSTLAKTIADVEAHLTRLPTLAQGEAQRVRQMVQQETDQLLDLSARTIATIHARNAQGSRAPQITGPAPSAPAELDSDGLKGLARKLTQRPAKPRADMRSERKPNDKWEMKTLLAAAEGQEASTSLQPGSAAALGALQMALADLAIDLDAIHPQGGPDDGDWKRYLTGDRTLFARRLAGVMDGAAIDRITTLYRDDSRFHDAAESYLTEFESLLARAKDGDGGGLLTASLLSADTGKIYLAIAYALGRL